MGQSDKGTKGLRVKGTKGQRDKKTKGQMYKGTKNQRANLQRTKGQNYFAAQKLS